MKVLFCFIILFFQVCPVTGELIDVPIRHCASPHPDLSPIQELSPEVSDSEEDDFFFETPEPVNQPTGKDRFSVSNLDPLVSKLYIIYEHCVKIELIKLKIYKNQLSLQE